MKTNFEKWIGNSKGKSNAGAGRDGKPSEKRDVKSILKGSRGAAKYGTTGSDFREPKKEYGNNEIYRQHDRSENSNERGSYSGYKGKPSFGNNRNFENRENRSFNPNRNYSEGRDDRPTFRPKRSFDQQENRPYQSENRGENRGRSYGDKPYGERSYSNNRPQGEKPYGSRSYGEKSYDRNQPYRSFEKQGERPERLSFRKKGETGDAENSGYRSNENRYGDRPAPKFRSRSEGYDPNAKYSKKKQLEFRKVQIDPNKPVRLNKYLANAGICSRREADEYIAAGVITVNGTVITEMGTKILPADKVMFHEQTVRSERKVYLLLNKPKDCVTTSEDTHDRLTVLDLVKNACSERIYPVGRLDRNTTGVLLLTNDGDLASRLTHPKYDKKKIYHVALDKELTLEDYETIMSGVQLDDITIAADALEFVKDDDKKQVGIEIHSGQNRVVRRIFEKLNYKVIRLDRVYFAGLTKKNLPRGKYRFLTEREINILKMGAHE